VLLVGPPNAGGSGVQPLRSADRDTVGASRYGLDRANPMGFGAMCLTVPARVLAVEPDFVVIEADGRRRRASSLLTPDLEPGDWVVVGAGSVIRRIDARQAAEMAHGFRLATGSAASRATDRRTTTTPEEPWP
jgi:hydrogenase assembly chaperone HypC/HupF